MAAPFVLWRHVRDHVSRRFDFNCLHGAVPQQRCHLTMAVSLLLLHHSSGPKAWRACQILVSFILVYWKDVEMNCWTISLKRKCQTCRQHQRIALSPFFTVSYCNLLLLCLCFRNVYVCLSCCFVLLIQFWTWWRFSFTPAVDSPIPRPLVVPISSEPLGLMWLLDESISPACSHPCSLQQSCCIAKLLRPNYRE
jgi:hypothetical protein